MIREAKGNTSISLLGIEAPGEVVHTHSMLCVSAGDYAEPGLWGVLGQLPDKGTPSYIKINPLHLATRYSFLSASCTEFESALFCLSN